jgi:predicted ArsR family transcriptional regulator
MTGARQKNLHRRRKRVIEALKRNGPATAGRLAETLGVTAMAVRQHLYELEKEGVVRHEAERGEGQGRPSKRWRLTEAAAEFFPDGHGELVAALMRDLHDTLGEKAMEKLVARRTARQIADYGRRLAAAGTLEARLESLAEIRSEEGYMAEVKRQEDGSYLLVENHCAICAAARACTGLCASELECFQAVLGGDVRIERTSHILAGAARCAYRVEAGPAAA